MNLEEYKKSRKEYMQVIFSDTPQIKGVREEDGEWIVEVLGVPFGGHKDGKDEHGEYFSPRTDLMMDIGETRPATYFHGMTPRGAYALKPDRIGKAKYIRMDEQGHWFDVILDSTNELARRVWQAAKAKVAKASSSVVYGLKRMAQDGEILVWAFGELALFDEGAGRHPANQLAVVNMKALFDNAGIEYPESFTKTGEVVEADEKEDGDTNRILIIKR